MVVSTPSLLFLQKFIILSLHKQVVIFSTLEAPQDLEHQLCILARRSNGLRALMTVIDYALSLALPADLVPMSNLVALFGSLNYLLRSFPD